MLGLAVVAFGIIFLAGFFGVFGLAGRVAAMVLILILRYLALSMLSLVRGSKREIWLFSFQWSSNSRKK